jgi:RNA polymerase sigma-70 factor (ECF subfamily)
MNRTRRLIVPAIVLAATMTPARADEELTVASAPPVVVKTEPRAGASDVDPALKAIKVTFSKDMTDGSWSWTTASPATEVKTTENPSYDDDHRTCVLPVQLEAGKTYAVWVNSSRFQNFKDTDGRPAVPFLLVFETRK